MVAFPKPQKREAKPRKPLRRSRMRPGKRKSKHARRERHFGYMLFQKTRSCAACDEFGRDHRCQRDEDGNVEAAHVGERVGYRADDMDTIPLGGFHHRLEGWDSYSGPFKDWTREQRREWASRQIFFARVAWTALGKATRDYFDAKAGR